jgi:hypothetical protein
MTDYVEPPLCAALLTSAPDNFLEEGARLDAKLRISGTPGAVGKAVLSLEDFFGHKKWEGEYGFAVDATGETAIALPLDGLLPKGVYTLSATLSTKDGFHATDYFRLSLMGFLENKHKHRTLCANIPSPGQPRIDDVLRRYIAIGIGGIGGVYGAQVDERYLVETGARKYDLFHRGEELLSAYGGDNIRVGKEVLVKDLFKLTPDKITPAFLKELESACRKKAESAPWIRSWWLIGEPNASKLDNLQMADVVKLYKAAERGVRSADPSLRFTGPGPWNMMPSDGIRWYDNFLSAGAKEIKWDAFDMHTYRTLPEDPDLDEDTALFLSTLDKHGFPETPVYFGEGMYYPPYYLPEWRLSCYNGGASADHYYAGMPSYHMGWGEKIAAAFSARSWIMALKYADRVKYFECFATSERFFLDINLTPLAVQKVPNTIGSLLGDADFRKDIRFSPGVRCYVFEDARKRPVAALWSHLPEVDKGRSLPPSAIVPFGQQNVEIFDLMEAPVEAAKGKDGAVRLELPSFPVFARGEPGALEAFCEAFENARIEGISLAPVRIDLKFANPANIQLRLNNLLTRAYAGELVCSGRGGKQLLAKKLAIPAKGMAAEDIPLSEPLSNQELKAVDMAIDLKGEGCAPIKSQLSTQGFVVAKRRNPITIDGDGNDWAGVPRLPLKNQSTMQAPLKYKAEYPHGAPDGGDKDHSAQFSALWDDGFLYLFVSVKDDMFVSEDRKGLGERWENDTLQVYFDTLGNARSRSSVGFDTDDYNYDFFPMKDGELLAFRRFAPERQMCGGLETNVEEKAIKTAFKPTKDGYDYELAIPSRHLVPFRLESNSSCGFAIYLNDHDGKFVKSALTLTPPGTGAYMNPHLYPVMLLGE